MQWHKFEIINGIGCGYDGVEFRHSIYKVSRILWKVGYKSRLEFFNFLGLYNVKIKKGLLNSVSSIDGQVKRKNIIICLYLNFRLVLKYFSPHRPGRFSGGAGSSPATFKLLYVF